MDSYRKRDTEAGRLDERYARGSGILGMSCIDVASVCFPGDRLKRRQSHLVRS